MMGGTEPEGRPHGALRAVTGHLKTTGTGGHFTGGVLAQNVDLERNTVLGNAVISYSSCAAGMAMKSVASPVLARSRSWVDLY